MAECTPGISQVRPEMAAAYDHHHHHTFDPCCEQPRIQGRRGSSSSSDQHVEAAAQAGTKCIRAEIDTSPPFGSVKEAVTHFGGSGSWLPYYKFGDGYQAIEDINIKKVEEQAAELEKDLIVKELETLDVLEELATTKRIVEELKRQLQNESLRCVQIQQNPSSATKGMTKGGYNLENPSPFHGPGSSPDLILMELRRAKLNLGKTFDDLGVIQASVECLHKKMRAEKGFLEKTRRRLTSNFAGVLSLGEELKQARVMTPQVEDGLGIEYRDNGQMKNLSEAEEMSRKGLARAGPLRTAELRLVAARKMEEAARAAEAVALAEINALSGNERPLPGYVLPEPRRVASLMPLSPINHKGLDTEMLLKKKAQVNVSKMSILKKLKEAREEVNRSKQALEEALNKVETANVKQFTTEEALRKWLPAQEDEMDRERERKEAYYPSGFSNFPFHHKPGPVPSSPLNDMIQMPCSNPHTDGPNPVLRSAVSMRDVLSKKQQVVPQEYEAARPAEGGGERQKVALSQMLDELRGDLTFHPRAEKVVEQKQFFMQRRKFGFIHIALPMTKLSKKKVQDFTNVMN